MQVADVEMRATNTNNQSHPFNNNTRTVMDAVDVKPNAQCHSCSLLRSRLRLSEIPDNVESMGLRPIFDELSPWPRRIFWLLIVGFGIGFAAYQIITQIGIYMSYPVNIAVNVSYVNSIEFPRIIVCNMNMMRYSQLPPNISSGMDTSDYSRLFEPAIQAGYYDGQDWKEVYQQMAHQAQDMIIECIWEGIPCSAANFTTVFTDMGVCASFNPVESVSGKHLWKAAVTAEYRGFFDRGYTSHTGIDYGIRLILNAEVWEYINATMTIGFKVLVGDEEDPPYVGASGVYIPTEYQSSISVDRQKIVNLPDPWENCGQIKMNNGAAYKKALCEMECEADYLISVCNCTPLAVDREEVPICDPVYLDDCIGPALMDYIRHQPPCDVGTCVTDCLQVNYRSAVSQIKIAPWRVDSLASQLISVPSGHEASRDISLAEVRIYFARLMEEVVTHSPGYEVLTLLCDVGGALGLVIGASVVSIIEVFDFFIMRMIR